MMIPYNKLSLKTLQFMLRNELDRYHYDKIAGRQPDTGWVYNLLKQLNERRKIEKA